MRDITALPGSRRRPRNVARFCFAELRLAERNGRRVHRSAADIHGAISEITHPPRQRSPSASACGWDRGARGGARSGGRRCLALRDYYPFWRSRLETAEAGKLVTVDLSTEGDLSEGAKVKKKKKNLLALEKL